VQNRASSSFWVWQFGQMRIAASRAPSVRQHLHDSR
jgi:hypothetical protein